MKIKILITSVIFILLISCTKENVLITFIHLKSKDNIQNMKDHIKKDHHYFISEISKRIKEKKLYELKDEVEEYISRNAFTIEHQFEMSLMIDTLKIIGNKRSYILLTVILLNYNRLDLLQHNPRYIISSIYDVFRAKKLIIGSDIVYDTFYFWYAIDKRFLYDSNLWNVKIGLEQRYKKEAENHLKRFKGISCESMVFLKKNVKFNFRKKKNHRVIIRINITSLSSEKWNLYLKIRKELSKKMNVPFENISLRGGPSLSSLSHKDIRFDRAHPLREVLLYIKDLKIKEYIPFLLLCQKYNIDKKADLKNEFLETMKAVGSSVLLDKMFR